MATKIRFFRKEIALDKTLIVILSVIVVGVAARFLVSLRGSNFDFESYVIASDIIVHGGNVYAETTRYNYGPVWFNVLGFFRYISLWFPDPLVVFRFLIIALLTAADIVIALLLKKKFGLWAFVLFFLNPISIIITGYHNQFDNLAVMIGLLAMAIMPTENKTKLGKNHIVGLALLGLSLMTKHILFILPLWLAIRAKTLRMKVVVLMVPIVIFGLAFLPYAPEGHQGIMQNVFQYKSFANAPLINSLLSEGIIKYINPTALFIGALVAAGFITRKLPLFEAVLWYLLVLVIFAPAVANQYLAIVMPAAAALGFVFFIPYMILTLILLVITSVDALYIQSFAGFVPDRLLALLTPNVEFGQYRLIILMLALGALCMFFWRYKRKTIKGIGSSFKAEFQFQFKSVTRLK